MTLNFYPIWRRVSDNVSCTLYLAGNTANYNNSAAFLTNVRTTASSASYTGPTWFRDVTGECFEHTGTATAPGLWVAAQYGAAGVSSSVCTVTSNLNLNDSYYYNFKQYSTCTDTPTNTSITIASQSDANGASTTDSVRRQGSYDFYTLMGSPVVDQYVYYNNICWLYTGYASNGEPATGNQIQFDTTPPTTTLSNATSNCNSCLASQTYHIFSTCANPGTKFIGLGNTNGSTTVNTAENDALYLSLASPAAGQYFEFDPGVPGTPYCIRYEGLGTAAQTTGSAVSMNHTILYNVGIFYTECSACQASPTTYHKWGQCSRSVNVNIVGIGQTNTTANNATFYTNAGSPQINQVINLDIGKVPSDNCYEYLGTSSTAETAGFDTIAISTTSINTTCASCLLPPVYGCTNPGSSNYNPLATVNDGSCITPIFGCMTASASNYNPLATQDDGSCANCVYGCTTSTSSNYNALATCDDGSCIISSVSAGGCVVAFGTEECQTDGTSSITVDLSGGAGLTNVTTTVAGAPYGTASGCTPPGTIDITGLLEGQTVSVEGECSYTQENYDAAAGGQAPAWAFPDCGESEEVISINTAVYVYYDGTSLGEGPAKNAYESVMTWLTNLPDFAVDTVIGSTTQNVYHIAVAGERWLDWGTAALTGKFNNNQSIQNIEYKSSGGTPANTWQQIPYYQGCTAGSSCAIRRDPVTHQFTNAPFSHPTSTSKMIAISNWAHNTTTYGGHTVDPFYDTAEGSLIGQGMVVFHSTDGAATALNGNQVYIGHPPAAGTRDVLVICFADESTFQYHDGGSPDFGDASDTTYSASTSSYRLLNLQQPTLSFRDDYDEFITQKNIHTGGGKSAKFFLYPSKPATGCSSGGHKQLPLHALAAINSGNKTIPDGMWQVGTSPANACNPGGIGNSLDLIETENPYWTGPNSNTVTGNYGALDQHGWGVNVDEVTFNDQIFINDLTVFLGSGGTQSICDGSQCIKIKAVDENGIPVNNHPIKVNGLSAGNTNANGVVTHTLTSAGAVVINDCFTFAAVGSCYQTLVTVVVQKTEFTSALNCILGCMDPTSWNYNPLAGVDDGTCMFPLVEDPRDSMSRCELLKIDTECKFATDVYNLYKYQRYGLDKGCLYNMDGRASKKYSSDWVDNLITDYGPETLTKTLYTKGAANPPSWVDPACGGDTCDDSECLVIIVEDKLKNRIPDYNIVLDGIVVGKTDDLGVLRVSVPNAAEDVNHKLNFCHCFTTTGSCNSQRIELTVDGVNCNNCGDIKMF